MKGLPPCLMSRCFSPICPIHFPELSRKAPPCGGQGAGALHDAISKRSTSKFVGTLENGRHTVRTLTGLCIQRPSLAAPADQTEAPLDLKSSPWASVSKQTGSSITGVHWLSQLQTPVTQGPQEHLRSV